MCTAATYTTKDFYFGRTLDNDCSYDEQIAITPRNYAFDFYDKGTIEQHFALIGMAHVEDGYPMYYEAVNEKGLAMAGLNFVGNAYYTDDLMCGDNVASYEFIPWILCQCATVKDARDFLRQLNVTEKRFREDLPPAPLHWIIADRSEAITVESVKEELQIYQNPVGILTNNPTFDKQLFQLNNYRHLSPKNSENCFSDRLALEAYCRGMGAIGLPGDLSSQSRFVRAAFVKFNSVSGETEEESVGQFFHILGSVEQPRGCSVAEGENYEITIYTCCCNADKGIYYYTTYDNRRITAVDMHKEDLEGVEVIRYPLVSGQQIYRQNG